MGFAKKDRFMTKGILEAKGLTGILSERAVFF